MTEASLPPDGLGGAVDTEIPLGVDDDTATIELLRQVPLFEAFTTEQLRWLAAHADVVTLERGQRIFAENAQPDHFWALIEGEWRIARTIGGHETTIVRTSHSGSWGGYIPWVTNLEFLDGLVLRRSRFLRVPPHVLEQMFVGGFPIAPHILAGLSWGLRNFETTVRQHEKLAALGKLSAGLAHELNNPAAAGRRAARQLRVIVDKLQDSALRLNEIALTPDQRAALDQLRRAALADTQASPTLDALARSALEDDVIDWLDQRDVPDAWDIAPALIAAGLERKWLERLADHVPRAAIATVVGWLHTSLEAAALAAEVEHATERISQLVGAIKEYSYMDQAAVQEVNIHDGIESTLTMLGHKLKNIVVQRLYSDQIPRITTYASELNQVWTNLIDNAVDAMGGRGTLIIRTTLDYDHAVVEIQDDGPGVPTEIQTRIWEPFYTTKPVGEGLGLGLDTVYRVVVERHDGEVQLTSSPGDTRFSVRLPLVFAPQAQK